MQVCVRSYTTRRIDSRGELDKINDYLKSGWFVISAIPVVHQDLTVSSYIEYILEKRD
jgi:hypothetical protein